MKKKIRVLHIHEKFYPHNGGSTHRLMNLITNLSENIELIVLCLKTDGACDYEEYNGLKIYRFEHYYEIPTMAKRICQKYGVDIIHSHNFRPTFYSRLVFFRGPRIMEMHSIYEPHGHIQRWISKKLYAIVDRIIVLSETSKDYLVRKYNLDISKVFIVYNGLVENKEVESGNIDSLVPNEIVNDKIKVVYIGSLDSFQGIDNIEYLINNSENTSIQYIIIGGEEEESKRLLDRIEEKRKVYVSPYVSSRVVNAIYDQADYLLVLRPDILMTETAIPLKPLEALQHNTIVLSTRVGGMIELAGKLQTNKIIFFNTVDECREYLDDLKDRPTEKEKECDVSLNLFSAKQQSIQLEKIYWELLGNNSR